VWQTESRPVPYSTGKSDDAQEVLTLNIQIKMCQKSGLTKLLTASAGKVFSQ